MTRDTLVTRRSHDAAGRPTRVVDVARDEAARPHARAPMAAVVAVPV